MRFSAIRLFAQALAINWRSPLCRLHLEENGCDQLAVDALVAEYQDNAPQHLKAESHGGLVRLFRGSVMLDVAMHGHGEHARLTTAAGLRTREQVAAPERASAHAAQRTIGARMAAAGRSASALL